MKHLTIFSLLVFGISTCLMAQDKELAAFASSYENEYHSNYLEAITVMESAYDENNYAMNLRLGWLCYMAAQHDKSTKYYNKAITNAPNSIEAKLGMVYPASALGNWSDVVSQYKNVLKLDATNSNVNYKLAYILYNEYDAKDALPYAEQVIKFYPFDFDANYLMGQIYADLGKKDQAKKHYEMALKYNPSSIVINRELKNL